MLNKFRYAYFIGIGGIGMSALARYFNCLDIRIFGYDKNPSGLCAELESEGIGIYYVDEINNIPDIVLKNRNETLIVYTPAIRSNNKIIRYFIENNYTVIKRSKVLGLITQDHFTIAVAGTHGKTTISSMIAHILHSSGINCTAFLGGISKNYQSNLIFSKEDSVLVVEADEFDRSFLFLNPDIAIISSVDQDHLDVYNTQEDLLKAFSDFSYNIKEGGTLFLEDRLDSSIFDRADISLIKYSMNTTSECYGYDIKYNPGYTEFNVNYQDNSILSLQLNMGGEYNVSNAVVSISTSKLLGVPDHKIVDGMKTFAGIKRRYEIHIETKDIVFIDDYAHHPSEIEVAILAVRKMYPGRKITVIFQPHLFTRTRDLLDEFGDALSLSDRLILLDIYAAREKEIEGISSQVLLEKCIVEDKELSTLNEVIHLISKEDTDILLTLGAGDISTIVDPIKKILL